DGAIRMRELDSVVKQNHHKLPQQLDISKNRSFLEISDLEADCLALGNHAGRLCGVERDVVEKYAPPLDGTLARVGTSQHEQILNKMNEPRRLALDSMQQIGRASCRERVQE